MVHFRDLGFILSGAAAALLGATSVVNGQGRTITLEEALRDASERHPDIAAAAADVGVAEGELVRARTVPYNPELSAAFGGGASGEEGLSFGSGNAPALSVGQTIEIGGKRGHRIRAAQARRGAAEARLDLARLGVRSRVHRAYFLAVAARERVATTRDGEAVAEELRTFAADRLRLGAGTQLEYNIAAAATGRARTERLTAQRRFREARAELGAAVFAPPGEDLEPSGTFPAFPDLPGDVEAFVTRALAQRADLRAARREREAAEREVALARALAVPDPTLAVDYERAPQDRKLLFGVTLPIPFFNRNQGGRAVARALEGRASIIEQATAIAIERDVRAAYSAYRTAREATQAFDREVIERLGENLDLARQSFQAGKISLLEYNFVRRDFVETRLSYLDALAALVETRQTLELAVGGPLE